jgi:hypothetical protein
MRPLCEYRQELVHIVLDLYGVNDLEASFKIVCSNDFHSKNSGVRDKFPCLDCNMAHGLFCEIADSATYKGVTSGK